MAGLSPESDQVVRQSVDAFLTGHRYIDLEGESVFETRNGVYRLMDGVLFWATASRLVGAELVGWLIESLDGSRIEVAWQPGARAVLVDPGRNNHIVITSPTRRFAGGTAPLDGSYFIQSGSPAPQPVASLQSVAPPLQRVESDTKRSSYSRDLARPERRPVHPPPRPLNRKALRSTANTTVVGLQPSLPPPAPPPVRPAPMPSPIPHRPLPAVTAPPMRTMSIGAVQRGMLLR